MTPTDTLTATIARVREGIARDEDYSWVRVSADDINAILAALASETERAERAEAERDDLLKDAAVEWRCPNCGDSAYPWQHAEARAKISELEKQLADDREMYDYSRKALYKQAVDATAERDAALAKLARVEGALRPFADAADALAGYRDVAVIAEYPLKFCISFTNGAGPDTVPVLHGRDFVAAHEALSAYTSRTKRAVNSGGAL